jgi:predicted nucleic acid-binding protein
MYECLHKPRKPTDHGPILQQRLRQEQQKGDFQVYPLLIEDLQDVALLESRKRLSKGELSAIALAMKIKQAFLTDDQKARKLAEGPLGQLVQTTPHLLGWLFFSGCLTDGDKQAIIDEHKKMGGLLHIHFERVYQESFRCQLLQRNLGGAS